MNFNLRHVTYSEQGVKRKFNQDSFLIIEKLNFSLYIIFDGVSSNALSLTFIEEYKKLIKIASENHPCFKDSISKLFYDINNRLIENNIEGMSTISALLFDKIKGGIKYLNIGDSRIYTFTNQFIEKITIDDSLNKSSNILTKCLGSKVLVLEDFDLHNLDEAQNYLMCTDGFYRMMETNLKEYFEILNFKNFSNIRNGLKKLQKSKNNDDSTIIIVRNEIPN
tara:strand:+ start:449 stop:1117 length:669 start_codon:yes stop_codon:yes gene_type:complete